MDGIKIEGGTRVRLDRATAIIDCVNNSIENF